MEKKKILMLVLFLGVILVVAIAISYATENTEDSILDEGNKTTKYNYAGGIEIVPGEYRDVVFNDKTGDYRPDYGISAERYEQFFGELPPFPEDFFHIAELVYSGKVTDYARISEEYYMQPEFYPAWFSIINESYIYNDPYMWTPEGYGCYPCIKEVEVPKGTTVVVNTYFRTGFATEAYQGIILKTLMPEYAKDLRGKTIFEQPKDAGKYITAKVTNPDDKTFVEFKDNLLYNNVDEGEWFTILKPTYRLLKDKYGQAIGEKGFPSDWVRILEVEIDIAKDIPAGDYVVALDVEIPCFDINQEYYFSQDHDYYGALYYPAGSFHRSAIPHFQVIMKIK